MTLNVIGELKEGNTYTLDFVSEDNIVLCTECQSNNTQLLQNVRTVYKGIDEIYHIFELVEAKFCPRCGGNISIFRTKIEEYEFQDSDYEEIK